jgi:hypothetical protein
VSSKKSLGVLLALIPLLSGCHSKGDNATEDKITASKVVADSSLPDGWSRAEAKGDKLSIGIPPSWHAADLTKGQLDKAIAASGDPDPGFASAVKSMAANKSFKLLIMHEPEGDFATNLTVVEVDAKGLTLEQVKSANIDGLKGDAKGAPEVSELKVDGTDAVEIKYEHLTSPVKEALDADAYLILKNGKQYLLTFTVPKGSAISADFASMVKTFHVG